MTYIIFTLLHNLLDFFQVNLFKIAKHWDSFFTHCTSPPTPFLSFSPLPFPKSHSSWLTKQAYLKWLYTTAIRDGKHVPFLVCQT